MVVGLNYVLDVNSPPQPAGFKEREEEGANTRLLTINYHFDKPKRKTLISRR